MGQLGVGCTEATLLVDRLQQDETCTRIRVPPSKPAECGERGRRVVHCRPVLYRNEAQFGLTPSPQLFTVDAPHQGGSIAGGGTAYSV